MRSTRKHCAISASLLALGAAFAMPVLAQTQTAPASDTPAVDPTAESDTSDSDANEIVVTGSLIQRPNNSSASPIVSVSDQAIRETGAVSVVDALNQIPSFTTSGNASTGGQGTGGRATVNLHGLGSNRNLVLLDGRRLPVSDINGNVDINILPDAILGGVDVITGGASAVYGSDAISGVVNFKTVRSLEGFRVDLQTGISERGDAFKTNGSLAFGTKFGEDRGNVIAAFSYAKQDSVNGSTRRFFDDKTPSSFIGTGTFVPSAVNAPTAAAVNGVFSSYGVTGAVNPLLNLGFNNDGTLFVQTGATNYRGLRDSGGYLIVGNNVRMPVGQQIDFQNALERKTAFLKADYELAPALTLYGQFMYVDLTVHTESGGSLTQFGALTTIPVTNPFIPANLRTILASRPNASAPFTWNGRYVGVPYKNWDEDYTIQQYMVGLRGDLAPGWTFDAFASYDESVHDQQLNDAVVKSRVQTLLNAADGGRSLCAGGFNIFGDANARSLSPACVAYITKTAFSREDLSQTQVQGQVNGKLFDLGAGPAQLAILGAFRRNTYDFVVDSDVQAQNIESVIASAPANGKITVKEIAAQIDVPLLAEKPFFHELGVGAAVRLSDYSVTGSVTSYEADARWRPIPSLLIRGSYQRAVRAPNIGELFTPASGAQLVIGTPPGALGDPCDVRSTARSGANAARVAALCVAQGVPGAAVGSYTFPTTAAGQTIAGNTDLTPEKADTFNVGFVFDSPANEGIFGDFTLSADYYNIKVSNVISTVPGLTVLSKCFNLDGTNPTYDAANEYCALIRRTAAGEIDTVNTPFLNIGGLRTDGIEVQANWSIPTSFVQDSGRFFVNAGVDWTRNYKVQLLPGSPFLDYTGISNGGAGPTSVPPRATPKWKALSSFGYRSDSGTLGFRWRYQSKLRDVSAVLTPATAQVGVDAYSLWDMFATVKADRGYELRLGVNNLFDKKLPFVASSQNGTDVALYDAIGRSFYAGVRFNF
jgi:outer membrane receptor protein involved in Fe transport